ncbi:hypothetical protein KA005_50460, partial [bacterium]|nr:hypothetical protein [bacterium]
MRWNKHNGKLHSQYAKFQGWCVVILILSTVISYGYFWTRGGYGDDFVFLAYSTSHSYGDAVRHWGDSFNSRISQGVVMPLLMKGLAGSNPEGFHWGIFHGIGIIALFLTVFLMNEILRIFNIPWRVRLIACLFFALHPIKNEAIFWPAAIVGYVLPFLVFLFASRIYLARAKQGDETTTSLIVVFILILFSMFSIEQLVPLFSVLVLIRLLFFKAPRIQIMSNLLGLILLAVIFIIVTSSGSTTDRIEQHPFPGIASLPTQIMSVLSNSSVDVLNYPFRILLDSYYWKELLSVVIGFDFLLVAISLIFLFWLLTHRVSPENCNPNFTPKMLRPLFLAGFIIWTITLSPFMVTSYYIPNRALYIPLFGFSIMVAVLYEYIFQ